MVIKVFVKREKLKSAIQLHSCGKLGEFSFGFNDETFSAEWVNDYSSLQLMNVLGKKNIDVKLNFNE